MSNRNVTTIGVPGGLIDLNQKITHYVTKIGGNPCLPSSFDKSTFKQIIQCELCKNPLSLILQVI